MKKSAYFLFGFLFLFCQYSVKSQTLDFGITGNIGMSKITFDRSSDDFKNEFALSGNLGIFIEKKIGEKSALGIEALWVQMQGKETSDERELRTFNGQELVVTGLISDVSRAHTTYLGLPIYYRLKLGKLGIKAGVQPQVFLFGTSSYSAVGEFEGEPIDTKTSGNSLSFNLIDFGPKLGLDYQLNANFRLRIDYYHGLTDITSETASFERMNRQICVGAQYFFGKK